MHDANKTVIFSLSLAQHTAQHMATPPAPRYIVSIDFGTTYSGVSILDTFAPDSSHQIYDWPRQAEAGYTYSKVSTVILSNIHTR